MSDELAEMFEHFKIRQVLQRYCRGVDRLDKALLDSVYWPEATDNHGVYVGPGAAFSDWLFPVIREHCASTLHYLGQSNIWVEGELATAETYFHAVHRLESNHQVDQEVSYGRYVDRFEKRADEWRISDHVVVMEHAESVLDVPPMAFSVDQFERGRRSEEDLSYQKPSG